MTMGWTMVLVMRMSGDVSVDHINFDSASACLSALKTVIEELEDINLHPQGVCIQNSGVTNGTSEEN